jgi:hypothetical protein
MKTRLILGFLFVMLSLQTMGMGHPHNLFAARKLVKTKAMRTQTVSFPLRTASLPLSTGRVLRQIQLVFGVGGV